MVDRAGNDTAGGRAGSAPGGDIGVNSAVQAAISGGAGGVLVNVTCVYCGAGGVSSCRVITGVPVFIGIASSAYVAHYVLICLAECSTGGGRAWDAPGGEVSARGAVQAAITGGAGGVLVDVTCVC